MKILICFSFALTIFELFAYFVLISPLEWSSSLLGVILNLVFGVSVLSFIFNYIIAWLTDAGSSPKDWRPNVSEEELATVISQATTEELSLRETFDKAIRYCAKCKKFKPPRTHHCQYCKRCVVRMDHHCSWIDNCIGHGNLKAFLLFLLSASTALLTLSTMYILSFIQVFWFGSVHNPYTLFHWILFFLSFGALFLTTIFVAFTCHDNWALALTNQTTIELSAIGWAESACKSKGERFVFPYDKGPWRNFIEVFGANPLLWLIPIETSNTDGLHYPPFMSQHEKKVK
eukprot:TRINITY_DN2585_c0_g1_i1.p1 TRINITY_DN2585_c0_g1~~TRINITY_DN2585_c0_g1_i1.p1  ORF type:complete len:288 (-),score=-0.74 TRINITY_DN2585_c0_g1_i1:38-901(-)